MYAGVISKPLCNDFSVNKLSNSGERVGRIKIIPCSETIVRLLAEIKSTTAARLVEGKKLMQCVSLGESQVNVLYGCVITSVLNAIEKEVNITEPIVNATKVYSGEPWIPVPKDPAERDKSKCESVK
jgi:hypothetical protein